MADQYKKVIVPKESLPALLTQLAPFQVFITGASVGTRLDGADDVPIITYITSAPHGLKTGDVVEIVETPTIPVLPPAFAISASKIIVLDPQSFSVDKALPSGTPSYISGGKINQILSSYVVRYRIISEDRNRFSAWSPQHVVSPAPLVVDTYSDLSVTKVGGLLILVWPADPSAAANSYDIYVAWGAQANSVGLTEYYTTVSGNQLALPIRENMVSAQIWIQSVSFPRKRVPDSTVASTNGVISVA
jgi:hypothetical protein